MDIGGDSEALPGRRGEVVVAAGQRLEYVWHGPGPRQAPTLVFLHDGLGCVSTWRDVPAALAAATGCGALVYSRAGYGRSSAASGPLPVRFMHDEAQVALPAVLAALGVHDGFLVGHSDGASIALIYAAGLTGVGGAPGGGPWLRGVIVEAPHVFVEAVCVESIGRLAAAYGDGELESRMARHHGANADDCFARWAEIWLRPEFRAWNIEAALPDVRCPVLAIQGAEDEYGTLAQLRAVVAGCSGRTETLVVASCGHTPHHQQRVTVLAAMERFIRRLL